jgi:hypothetical protein
LKSDIFQQVAEIMPVSTHILESKCLDHTHWHRVLVHTKVSPDFFCDFFDNVVLPLRSNWYTNLTKKGDKL